MKVIVIERELGSSEDRYLGGVAQSYRSAITFLLEGKHLTSYTATSRPFNGKWGREVEETFGENWKDIILNELDINTFNEIFDGAFYLSEEEVYTNES